MFFIITVLVLIWNFITAHENACLEKENKMCARTIINLTKWLFVSKYKLNFSNLFICLLVYPKTGLNAMSRLKGSQYSFEYLSEQPACSPKLSI